MLHVEAACTFWYPLSCFQFKCFQESTLICFFWENRPYLQDYEIYGFRIIYDYLKIFIVDFIKERSLSKLKTLFTIEGCDFHKNLHTSIVKV